ncbi:MAG: hypothetical protein WCO98_02320 [bacterium]
MRKSIYLLLIIILTGIVSAVEPQPLLSCSKAKDFKTAFANIGTDWKVNKDGLEGRSPLYYSMPGTKLDGMTDDTHTYCVVHPVNMWRYAITGSPSWQDYTVETTMCILEPAPLKGPRVGSGNVFMNYQWGREAVGTDAGIIIRYQGPDSYYQLRFSSGYGHVELWKTKGGVVCVKPYAIKPQQDMKVTVTASGRWIIVAIDDKELMRYYDPVEPITRGQAGFAVRESLVRFSDLNITPAAPITDPAPKHVANFKLREWVGHQYIFDGDEPIGWINPKDTGVVQEVKLVPGLMPMLLFQPGATWGDLNWKPQVQFTLEKEGDSLVFNNALEDKDGRCTGTGKVTITYDPQVGYIWDNQATINTLLDDKMSKWNLNIVDPCFYQTVAMATNKMPAGRSNPNYALYTRNDGKYGAFPANHQYKNSMAQLPELLIKKGGFFATTVDNWAAAMEVPADNNYQYYADYCAWGLDQHVAPVADFNAPNWAVVNIKAKKGDTYQGHARIYAIPPAKVQEILRQAILPNNSPSILRELIAHVEPVNNCTDIVTAVAGDSKVRWTGDYTIDRTIGHNDTTSMRLADNSSTQLEQIGPSYRTGPYLADNYRFGVWANAKDFTGKVTLTASNFVTADGHKITGTTSASLNIDGNTNDWQYISFENSFPHGCHFWNMAITTQGKGTLYADDFELSPITSKEK